MGKFLSCKSILFSLFMFLIMSAVFSCSPFFSRDEKVAQKDPGSKIEKIEGLDKTHKSSMRMDFFNGSFKLKISSFRGILYIGKKNNIYYGYMSFPDWGDGKPQELKNLHVDENKKKIYFVRSVQTPEEAKKYNSKRYFVQKFYGKLTKDGKRIKGYYIDSGAEASWQAER